MNYKALMHKIILDEMSPEDRRSYLQSSMQSHQETMRALQKQANKLDEIHKSQSWLSDFGANIAGNAVWDGAVWVLSRLLRR